MNFMFLLLLGIHALAITPLKINFQINQFDPLLKKHYQGQDSSKLCWPSALAHRLHFIKSEADSDFPNLKLENDPVANVEKLVRYCKTSPTGGTSQKRKIPCIEQVFREAGYKIRAFSIGADSTTEKRAVKPNDLRSAIEKNQGIILHIEWWRLKPKTKKWAAIGSHSVNAYTFFYDDKKQTGTMKVVDPAVDYLKYHPDRMYDEVTVIPKDSAIESIAELELVSGRFNSNNRKAVLKNIYVFGKNPPL